MKKNDLIAILANGSKAESSIVAGEIEEYVKAIGFRSNTIYSDVTDTPLSLPFDTKLVITLGGDGTVLYAARTVHELGVPILPVNLGTFGYITEVGKNEWKDTLDAFLNGEDIISRRLMLRISVMREGRRVFSGFALNEAVVSSSGIAKVINLGLLLDKTSLGNFRADGIIIATPTGSTGYSLAAGGPILDAEMSAVIITPVCPFTLSNRPLVTSGKLITVKVQDKQRTDILLTVDGQQYFELQEEDEIIVEKSRNRMLLIHSIKRNFTEVIRDKLNWSGAKHA